jgi:cell fate regulator YaaT (PSP1 superfamily)
MNVFDWLTEVPLADAAKSFDIIEVSFSKGSRKDYYRNSHDFTLVKGDMVAVEGVNGFDVGMVNLTGHLVRLQMKKYSVKDNAEIRKVLRLALEADLEVYYQNKDREQEVLVRSRAIAKQHQLDMKIAEVEIQADGKKATFFYTADGRVDFRELIRTYATDFRLKVEMKQIGARQESGKVGGIGSCGRELCCSTWLSDFKSVNTTAARYQNLSINQTKLSGQCGRLKCCLNYELDTYMDALRVFPRDAETLETAQGLAYLNKRDIFKNLMWYGFKGSTRQYPVPIERVREVIALNKEGIKPEELGAVELEVKIKGETSIDKGYVNDVGQISLKALEKGSKNKNKRSNRDRDKDAPPRAEREGGGSRNRGSRKPEPAAEGSGQPNAPQAATKPGNPRPERKAKKPRPAATEGAANSESALAPQQGRNPQRQPRPDHRAQQASSPDGTGAHNPSDPKPRPEQDDQQASKRNNRNRPHRARKGGRGNDGSPAPDA